MKALIGSGLCLALALVSARSFAEEIQWRSAAPAPGAPKPAAGGAVITPVAFTVVAPAQPTAGIGLGRPVAASGSVQDGQESNPTDFRPALDRPLAVVRGQAPDIAVQPMPVGFPLTQDSGKAPKGTTVPQPVTPMPMTLEPDFVGPMPKTTRPPTVSDPYGSSSYLNAGVLDGGGLVSMGDCGCGCFQENSCGCDDPCPYRGRIWGSASYLGWAFQQKNVPPLVTVSPVGTSRATSGVLGVPTTLTVFDQSNQESLYHSGGRFNFGFWMPGGNWGLEADYFFLSQNSTNATFGSNGDPQFARPIVNAVTGQEASQLVSFPGVVTGNVSVNMFSQMWGLEINARQKLFCGPGYWVDMLYGYRHLDLSEGITISEALNTAGGLGIGVTDQFHTRNIFDGGQIGIQSEWHFLDRFFVGGTLKLAMGNMHEQVNIAGVTGFTPPGGPATTVNGGILALPTNIGNYQFNRFAVMPETNFKIGYEFNDHWRVWAGYDFLFVSSVVRPGDQIDRRVNPTQVPAVAGPQPLVGVAQPAALLNTTTFFAQGVSVGLQYRW